MVHPIHDYVLGLSGSGRYYRVNADWGDRAPLLTLTDEHRAAGEAALRQLGIPEGAWYVCLHAREGGYSQEDERVHSYRNSDVLRLIPTIEYIVSRGGWCVRMGDPSMVPLPRMRGLVDYAHHPLRSPLLDVFLCATCRFFLGNTSGLFLVSTVFGVPSVLANMIPITSMGFGPRDLSIPKLLWSVHKRGYLTFAEVLRSDLANARISAAFRDAGVEPVENTAEDVHDLAAEMLDHIEGRGAQYEGFAPLQKRFARLLRPNHFCYGTRSRIGARFAHKYQDLLTQ
jgi:putative glycosyltransferase (TIGR04372 family)